ncbi:flagellin N-methylase [Helicobacter bilis]|uniref:Flagellin N-methylase n=1 Tax=Helicobacter bilis TaxID=37372 RepID=A0A1Q2LJ48_9HELI|nr:YkgJ family cysteine cluster protein [Helicobacter bilis]AQQ60520.1 flagellin N-methylase [Helicobacter bilis]
MKEIHNTGFPCTSCGACCKNIAGIKELESYDLGNGVCRFLDSNNMCSIYDSRPSICRVDIMFEKVYFKHYSKEEFYRLNVEACKTLQEKESVKDELRL